ncbi:MAG: membrane protein insertion efficiency factor YidD [Bacteroidales bacterium]|nr:membrane protein insertion efficiency factor YidD [Bacteroidales bacterium]MBK7628666.1 membrane protein insertion efficiency factor YidD [Bacteroidales bacterium]
MQKSVTKVILIVFLISFSGFIYGQDSLFISDIDVVRVSLLFSKPEKSRRSYIYKDEPLIKKLNPIGWVFGGTLYFYQNVLSKHISADCLFFPSCSDFSKEAIRETGLIRGTLLTMDRLSRCNRIAAHDLKNQTLDPVSNKYPDPVSRHIRKSNDHDDQK